MRRGLFKIKKLIPYLLAAALSLSPAISTTASEENIQADGYDVDAADKIVYVSSQSGLNIRSGPDKSYDKIGSLPYGDKVIVTGTTADTWYQIEYDGGHGYISMQYVSDTPPGSAQAPDEKAEETQEPDPETGTESDFDSEITDTETGFDRVSSLMGSPIFIILGIAIFAVIVLISYSVYGLFKKDGAEEDDGEDDELYDEDPDPDGEYDEEDGEDLEDGYPGEDRYEGTDGPYEDYPEEEYPEEDGYDRE